MLRALLIFLLFPVAAVAGPLRVVSDIPPVHSLVAKVMEGVGTSELLVPPGSSPHGFALRPSQARSLQAADVVVWIGPALTPWLDRAVHTLGSKTRIVTLLNVEGTHLLEFEDDGHGHDHGHNHDHGGATVDPHAWLDPANARVWLSAIANVLSEADPDNAALYRSNAETAGNAIIGKSEQVKNRIAAARETPVIFYHDAYRYFELAFGVRTLTVLAGGDAAAPGAARLSAVRDLLAAHPGTCIFLEPQIPSRAVEAIASGQQVKSAVLDPLGAGLQPGKELYDQVLLGIAAAIDECSSR